MSSTVALLAALVLIALAFRLARRDRRDAPVSTALWIPSFWALINGSRMVSQWLPFTGGGGGSVDAVSEGSPFDRNVFILLLIAAVVVIRRRHITVGLFTRLNPWLTFYLVYCALSMTWSDYPVVSLKRYIKEIENLLMALIILSEPDPYAAVLIVLRRCAFILMPLSIVLFKYFPDLGRSYSRWEGQLSVVGVTNNKNSLGVLSAMCALAMLAILLQEWKERAWRTHRMRVATELVMSGLTAWTLIAAHSATSIGCFIAGAAVLILGRLRVVKENILSFTLLAAGSAALLFFSGLLVSGTANALGRDTTLTGRTEVWHSVIALTNNPVVGCGYSSFWLGSRLERMWEIFSWQPTEAHDGYLEIYIELGIVGLVLLFSLFVSSFQATRRLIGIRSEAGLFWLAILVIAVIYNVTESAFRPGLLMHFMFVLVVARMPNVTRVPGSLGQDFAAGTGPSPVTFERGGGYVSNRAGISCASS